MASPNVRITELQTRVHPPLHSSQPSLLDKLYHYGFRGITNKWFSSHLEGRTQKTQIGSVMSPEKNITFGVPHGSVLGPLLFSYLYKRYSRMF